MYSVKTQDGYVPESALTSAGPISDCITVVKSADDFPAPDANGRRILEPSTLYLLCAPADDPNIRLGPGETLVQQQGTVIEGRHPELDIILANVDAPVVDGSQTGLLLSQLSIINENAGANAFGAVAGNAAQLANPAPTVSSIQGQCSFTGVGGLLVQNSLSLAMDGGVFRTAGQALLYRGIVVNAAIDDVTFFQSGGSAVAVDFEAGAQVSVCRFSACAFAVDLGQVGIRDSGATLQVVGCQNSQFFAPSGVPGTFLDGITQDGQTDVLFLSNFGIAESTFSGAMAIPSNAASTTGTLAAGVNTFVRVGSGSPGHPLYQAQNQSARFAVTGTEAQNQALVYTGPEPVTVNVEATASVRQAGIFQLLASMRIVYVPVATGIPEPGIEFDSVLADGFSGGGATGELSAKTPRLTLNPGDQLYIEIANRTNTGGNPLVDLIVTNISLSFG